MNEADPRVRRTRKLLADAFMALLAEKSFQAVSVQDIAERATLNRATFYAHFEDKYALMDYVIGERFREALARQIPAGAPFTRENLRLLTVAVCEFLGQFLGSCHGPRPATGQDADLRFAANVQQALRTYLLAWLAGAPSGAGATGAQREALASQMSWAIFGAGIEWTHGGRTRSGSEVAREVVAAMVEGIDSFLPASTAPDAGTPGIAQLRSGVAKAADRGGRPRFSPRA